MKYHHFSQFHTKNYLHSGICFRHFKGTMLLRYSVPYPTRESTSRGSLRVYFNSTTELNFICSEKKTLLFEVLKSQFYRRSPEKKTQMMEQIHCTVHGLILHLHVFNIHWILQTTSMLLLSSVQDSNDLHPLTRTYHLASTLQPLTSSYLTSIL